MLAICRILDLRSPGSGGVGRIYRSVFTASVAHSVRSACKPALVRAFDPQRLVEAFDQPILASLAELDVLELNGVL